MVSGEGLMERYGAMVLWFGTGYGVRVALYLDISSRAWLLSLDNSLPVICTGVVAEELSHWSCYTGVVTQYSGAVAQELFHRTCYKGGVTRNWLHWSCYLKSLYSFLIVAGAAWPCPIET